MNKVELNTYVYDALKAAGYKKTFSLKHGHAEWTRSVADSAEALQTLFADLRPYYDMDVVGNRVILKNKKGWGTIEFLRDGNILKAVEEWK